MNIKTYLQNKYQFELNSVMPSDMLENELHITPDQRKELVRIERNNKQTAKQISFSEYCNICQNYLA